MCSLCIGKIPGGKCTSRDPYSGFEGAFRCLLEAGDVAFLKHSTVNEMIASKEFSKHNLFLLRISYKCNDFLLCFFNLGSVNADRFELLCKDGQRRPLSEYRQCNWGLVPSHALVTSSARTSEERKHYQQFMTKVVSLYSSKPVTNYTTSDKRYEGVNRFDTKSDDKYYDQKYLQNQNFNPNFGGRFDDGRSFSNLDNGFTTERNQKNENDTQVYEKFDLFESERYDGRLNLMFQDSARNLVPIKEDDQSFSGYLGQSLLQIFEVRQCPVNRMTLCVTSDPELEKCVKMRVSQYFSHF